MSVYFTDANTGFAVGQSGTIIKTNNGGTTWFNISSGTGNLLRSVYFPDANTGYAVGKQGTIMKTTDSGATWTAQESGTTDVLFSVYFTDANTGYVSGDQGTILKTTNGGGPPVGINEKQQTKSLKIYPNPATENITIEQLGSGIIMNGTILIYGMDGQELISQQVNGSKVELNVGSLPKGLYFVRLMNSEKTGFGKFIKG